MAQEPHRDIHLPPQGTAPHAQHPKTAPHAVPLDEAAFRSLPPQDDSAVFTALADGASAPAPHAAQSLPRQGWPAFRCRRAQCPWRRPPSARQSRPTGGGRVCLTALYPEGSCRPAAAAKASLRMAHSSPRRGSSFG